MIVAEDCCCAGQQVHWGIRGAGYSIIIDGTVRTNRDQ
jgi:hypothetical protein